MPRTKKAEETVLIQVRVPMSLAEKIDAAATKTGITRTEWVRRHLAQTFEPSNETVSVARPGLSGLRRMDANTKDCHHPANARIAKTCMRCGAAV